MNPKLKAALIPFLEAARKTPKEYKDYWHIGGGLRTGDFRKLLEAYESNDA